MPICTSGATAPGGAELIRGPWAEVAKIESNFSGGFPVGGPCF